MYLLDRDLLSVSDIRNAGFAGYGRRILKDISLSGICCLGNSMMVQKYVSPVVSHKSTQPSCINLDTYRGPTPTNDKRNA